MTFRLQRFGALNNAAVVSRTFPTLAEAVSAMAQGLFKDGLTLLATPLDKFPESAQLTLTYTITRTEEVDG